jgi:hypothetical protein
MEEAYTRIVWWSAILFRLTLGHETWVSFLGLCSC